MQTQEEIDALCREWSKRLQEVPLYSWQRTPRHEAILAACQDFADSLDACGRPKSQKRAKATAGKSQGNRSLPLDGLTAEEREFAARVPARTAFPMSSRFGNRPAPSTMYVGGQIQVARQVLVALAARGAVSRLARFGYADLSRRLQRAANYSTATGHSLSVLRDIGAEARKALEEISRRG